MFIIALCITAIINYHYLKFLFLFNHQVIQEYIPIVKIQLLYIKVKSSFVNTDDTGAFLGSY